MLNLLTSDATPCEFSLRTHVLYGPHVSERVPDWLAERDIRKISVVVDAGVSCHAAFQRLRDWLGTGFSVRHELINRVSEPDYDYLEACRQDMARTGQGIDCLIAVGGGSTLDLAKALSVLATNPGPAISYRGFKLIKHAGIPVVAIPTTAGTGAEVTPNAVFTDRHEKRRLGINTPLYIPTLAVLDPVLTVTCPKSVTIASGIDALMQAIDSFASAKATPTSRIFSEHAFALVFRTLLQVVQHPEDLALRGAMQLGAYYSGIALMNASSGPAGALSYPLDVHFGVPHGLAHAVFQPSIVRWNVEHGYTGYANLYSLIQGGNGLRSASQKSQAFCERLSALYVELGVHQTLRPYGVTENHVEWFGQQAMSLRQAIESNPVALPPEALAAILERML